MVVYQLGCAHGHSFEAWFGKASAFDEQRERALVVCAVCGNVDINKLPAGINLAKYQSTHGESASKGVLDHSVQQPKQDQSLTTSSPATAQVANTDITPEMRETFTRAVKEFIQTNTENVGTEFAKQARQMHYGEAPQRNIRGKVTNKEAQALQEEGVTAWPIPPGIKFNEDVQ